MGHAPGRRHPSGWPPCSLPADIPGEGAHTADRPGCIPPSHCPHLDLALPPILFTPLPRTPTFLYHHAVVLRTDGRSGLDGVGRRWWGGGRRDLLPPFLLIFLAAWRREHHLFGQHHGLCTFPPATSHLPLPTCSHNTIAHDGLISTSWTSPPTQGDEQRMQALQPRTHAAGGARKSSARAARRDAAACAMATPTRAPRTHLTAPHAAYTHAHARGLPWRAAAVRGRRDSGHPVPTC